MALNLSLKWKKLSCCFFFFTLFRRHTVNQYALNTYTICRSLLYKANNLLSASVCKRKNRITFLVNKHRKVCTSCHLHVSPAEGAVVSVWFSPRLVDRCWAAASQCSSAGGSHKEAQSKGSPDG